MCRQFEELRAAELYCPRCQQLRPVRERLLLVLPDGDLQEYRCPVCAASLGTRQSRTRGPAPLPTARTRRRPAGRRN